MVLRGCCDIRMKSPGDPDDSDTTVTVLLLTQMPLARPSPQFFHPWASSAGPRVPRALRLPSTPQSTRHSIAPALEAALTNRQLDGRAKPTGVALAAAVGDGVALGSADAGVATGDVVPRAEEPPPHATTTTAVRQSARRRFTSPSPNTHDRGRRSCCRGTDRSGTGTGWRPR